MIERISEFSNHQQLEQVRAALPPDVRAYLVGGAVRDLLLNRPVHDLDFVLLHTNVLEISRRIANRIQAAYYPLDQERDTARLILKLDTGERQVLDFSPPRAEDLAGDLRARDFTINAMAIDLHDPKTLIDPLGGANDLHNRELRACSETTFSDDPARILRAIRQAVDLKLRILPETNERLRAAIHWLPNVSAERQRDELFRILDGRRPETALRVLDKLDVMPYLLPEIHSLKGVLQSPPHTGDAWTHTLKVVGKLSGTLKALNLQHDPEFAANWALGLVSLRLGRYRQQIAAHLAESLTVERSRRSLLFFAALYHDSGKPDTALLDDNGRTRFLGHELVSEELVSQRAQNLRLSNHEVQYLRGVVRHHMRPLFLTQTGKLPSQRAIYRFFRDCGPQAVDICLLSLADVLGTYDAALPQDIWRAHVDVIRALFEAHWESQEPVLPAPLLSGGELIRTFDLQPAPLIGELLEALREAQAVGSIQDRAGALDFAETWLKENQSRPHD